MNNNLKFYAPGALKTSPAPRERLTEQLNSLCAQGFQIFIDTCSLLEPGGIRLLEAVERVFPGYNKQLMIFRSVIAEVGRIGSKYSDKRRRAGLILKKIDQLEKKGIIHIIAQGHSSFSDVNFISDFILLSSGKSKGPLLLITQDRALAEKITGISTYLGDVVRSSCRCEAMRLTPEGGLKPFDLKQPVQERDTLIFGQLFKFR